MELGNAHKAHLQLISYLLLILFNHSLSLATIASCIFYYFSINLCAKANRKGKYPYDSLSAFRHLRDDTCNNLQRKDMRHMDMSDNNKGNTDQDESS